MARIRTIKPEFFTSEDIVALDPMTRLLYIALWCEADREGRLQWKPRTFKMRYFPADDIDIDKACGALLEAGLVVLYGEGMAYIPSFTVHQHVNPRESASILPAPKDVETFTRVARVSTRESTVSDVQVGREGKERKGKDDASARRGSRLPADWSLTDEYREAARDTRPDWPTGHVESVAAQFRDYWIAQPGEKGVKTDWLATWRNWCRRDTSRPQAGGLSPRGLRPRLNPADHDMRGQA